MTNPKTEFAALVPAVLRTAVPSWWGALAAWLLAHAATYLPDEITSALAVLLDSEPARALAVAVVIGAWYLVWRRFEPHVPDWLVRLTLGSIRTPSYAPVVDGVPQITTLRATDEQRASLRDLYLALDEGDPARDAIAIVLRSDT